MPSAKLRRANSHFLRLTSRLRGGGPAQWDTAVYYKMQASCACNSTCSATDTYHSNSHTFIRLRSVVDSVLGLCGIRLQEHLFNGKAAWVRIPPMPFLGNRDVRHCAPYIYFFTVTRTAHTPTSTTLASQRNDSQVAFFSSLSNVLTSHSQQITPSGLDVYALESTNRYFTRPERFP